MQPRISLLIPTRERPHTLRATLQTALRQSADGYEIIVSDNASSDDTQQVVAGFNDPRIQYVNTGRRVSMRDNFEFALSHARGDYIMTIGDDDGILPGAIDALLRLLETHPYQIYTWDFHTYVWPSQTAQAYVKFLALPRAPREIDLRNRVQFSLRWGGLRFAKLPNIYHSLIKRSLFEQIASQTGRVLHSTQPDIFTAFALPALVNKALHVGMAMSVDGKSDGISLKGITRGTNTHMEQRIQRFFQEYPGYAMHPTLFPGVQPVLLAIADAILVAMDCFPKYYSDLEFNYAANWAWQQVYWDTESVSQILQRRKQLRQYHPFSSIDFLFRWSISQFMAARSSRRKVVQSLPESAPPTDIDAFVVSLAHTAG